MPDPAMGPFLQRLDCCQSVCLPIRKGEGGHTAVLPGSTVGRIPAHIENNSLDGDQCWAVRIRACYAESVSQSKKNNRDIRHTVAFRQLLRADGIVLGRIQLDGHLGREALGFFFVFDHFECFERECVCE